jgi:hypothetical protein
MFFHDSDLTGLPTSVVEIIGYDNMRSHELPRIYVSHEKVAHMIVETMKSAAENKGDMFSNITTPHATRRLSLKLQDKRANFVDRQIYFNVQEYLFAHLEIELDLDSDDKPYKLCLHTDHENEGDGKGKMECGNVLIDESTLRGKLIPATAPTELSILSPEEKSARRKSI